MKLLYFFLLMFVILLGGYLYVNDFSFDNTSFSGYLLNTLFFFLLSLVGIITLVLAVVSIKRRSAHKGIMTIRQYYEYKEYKTD
ncbi:hypothetical protein [Flavobacterium beibuense]|nr:hypothetical protein [Flavobacterium beibuense]